jgi:hypothetical protein
MASSISGSKAVTNSYESISTVTVSTAVSSISFSSIPSTFKHLQIRGIARDSAAVNDYTVVLLQFNGDTGSNYARHNLFGNGASAGAGGASSTTSIRAGVMPLNSTTANAFGANVFDILEYGNTNIYKTIRGLSGTDTNTTTDYVQLTSGVWQSTSAVTSITLTSGSANFMQYSQFALYGIKGA